MQVNKQISVGNIVSWGLILLAFVVSYGRLQGTVAQAQSEAADAAKKAATVQDQFYRIEVGVARIEERIKALDAKIDERLKKSTRE